MHADSDDQTGQVRHILLNKRTRQPMQRVDEVMAIPGAGLMGCRHSRPGNDRSVLLVPMEVLAEFALDPGQLRENITTHGLGYETLTPGAELQVGETVVLQVTGPCDPCRRMDEIRAGLQRQLIGKRGINTRVVIGGKIRCGDTIRLVKVGRTLP